MIAQIVATYNVFNEMLKRLIYLSVSAPLHCNIKQRGLKTLFYRLHIYRIETLTELRAQLVQAAMRSTCA